MNPRRHHSSRRHGARRNPPRGLAFLGHAAKGGLFTYGGRIANKKLANVVQGFLPAPAAGNTIAASAETVLAHLGVASLISLAAMRFMPQYAEPIAFGAMAEAEEQIVMQTPAAPYLSAYTPVRRIAPPAPVAPGAAARAAAGLRAYAQLKPGNGGTAAYVRRPANSVNVS